MAVPVGPIIKLAGEVVKAGVTTKVIEKVVKIVLQKGMRRQTYNNNFRHSIFCEVSNKIDIQKICIEKERFVWYLLALL